MKREIRRDTWSCGAFALFAIDRFSKIFANKGITFDLGSLSYSLTEGSQILIHQSARGRALLIMPPLMLAFWLFYKCGGMKSRLWTMFVMAGMTAQAYDILMTSRFQYAFSLTTANGATIFSIGTICLLLGTITGIFELAFETFSSVD